MTHAIIECQQLSHHFSGTVALSDLSCSLYPGEPIGLVGPNGAGKTTLLRILAGFLRPSSGTVSLLGCRPGDAALIGRVAALPQDAMLDPVFTIQEQLLFYARLQGLTHAEAKLDVQRVLEAVGLLNMAREKPAALSHGMAKRIAIAQAFIGTPEVVLLDEPTAGLDPMSVRSIRAMITEHAATTTFLISSHDLAELDRLCRQVLLLENGVLTSDTDAQGQQHENRFITLVMESCPAAALIAGLQGIVGVINVTQPQTNEFVVEYNIELQPQLDVQILQLINAQAWHYKQLTHGKSLEERLFFRD